MERSEELEEFVHAWFGSAARGDASVVDRHVSREPAGRLIGSDPDEWFQGEAVAEFLRGERARLALHREAPGSGGTVSISPRDTEAFSEGTVGWVATRLTITLPDGRKVSPRWSAVFHQEDGEWKIVQTHASIAVPNDEIGWVLLG